MSSFEITKFEKLINELIDKFKNKYSYSAINFIKIKAKRLY